MGGIAISVLHATRGRPKEAVAAMRLFHDRAVNPASIEYILAIDLSDPSSPDLMHAVGNQATILRFAKIHIVEIPGHSSVSAWDAAAKKSSGTILVQGQDDIQPPEKWDLSLVGWLYKVCGKDWASMPAVVAVSDGYRKDRLLCTAICNRARYEQEGEFLHKGYRSVFSDGDFTLRAYQDAKFGRCTLVEARELVMRHEHPYHNPNVPTDAIYQHENSNEAYGQGAQTFITRNPLWKESGFVDWL
jgi:hypothetical protein